MEYKIALVGPTKTGKTTFIKRILNNDFTATYTPTIGVEIFPLTLQTSMGTIKLNIWDTADDDRYCGLKDGYYISADAAILMMDNAQDITYRKHQIQTIYRRTNPVTNPDIPIVTVINKMDLMMDTRIQEKAHRISTKTDGKEKLYEVLLDLIGKLTHRKPEIYY